MTVTVLIEKVRSLRLVPIIVLLVGLLMARYLVYIAGDNRSVGDYGLIIVLWLVEATVVAVLALRFLHSRCRSISYGAALGAVAMIGVVAVSTDSAVRRVAVILFLVLLSLSVGRAFTGTERKDQNNQGHA